MARSLEYQTLTREVQGTITRMLGDAEKSSREGGRNRLLDVVVDELSGAFTDHSYTISRQRSRVTLSFDALAVFKVPQMLIMRRRITKRDEITEIPEDFFIQLEGSNDWNLRQAGLNREEVLATKASFQSMTAALAGEVPTIWLLTGVVLSLVKALRLRNYDDSADLVRSWGGPASVEMRQSILFGSFTHALFSRYLEPVTLTALAGALRDDAIDMEEKGFALPTHLFDGLELDELN